MIERIFKALASLKLAVFIIVGLAAVSAVGTFYESLYNAEYAQKVVYQSYSMFFFLGLLAVNLIAVMVDRLPWKKRHLPFLLAHIGILMVLFGALLTYMYGIDGSMVFPLGSSNRYVLLGQREFAIYSSFDGVKYQTMFKQEVDYFSNNPKKNLQAYDFGKDLRLDVIDYHVFAEGKSRFVSTDNKQDGPALRFFLEGSRAKQSGWLRADKTKPSDAKAMGLANLSLYLKKPDPLTLVNMGKNEVIFYPQDKNKVAYIISNREGKREGAMEIGDLLDTGWMDFKLRLINYKLHAREKREYIPIDYPHALSSEAVKVKFKGEEYFIGLNESLKVFEKDRVYIFAYSNRRKDIGFDIKLKDFKVGRYQGTLKAASYESVVETSDGERVISMNDPLKKNGLTFYQASFQEDETGQPTHSILSVNKDPGRLVKYLGSLLVAIGTILLFYFKRFGKVKRKGS